MTETRVVWKVTAIIEATPEDAERAQEAIARALCPDESHPGECPVRWTTTICRFEDLDDDEQAAWQADFDADRHSARDARPPGT